MKEVKEEEEEKDVGGLLVDSSDLNPFDYCETFSTLFPSKKNKRTEI